MGSPASRALLASTGEPPGCSRLGRPSGPGCRTQPPGGKPEVGQLPLPDALRTPGAADGWERPSPPPRTLVPGLGALWGGGHLSSAKCPLVRVRKLGGFPCGRLSPNRGPELFTEDRGDSIHFPLGPLRRAPPLLSPGGGCQAQSGRRGPLKTNPTPGALPPSWVTALPNFEFLNSLPESPASAPQPQILLEGVV